VLSKECTFLHFFSICLRLFYSHPTVFRCSQNNFNSAAVTLCFHCPVLPPPPLHLSERCRENFGHDPPVKHKHNFYSRCFTCRNIAHRDSAPHSGEGAGGQHFIGSPKCETNNVLRIAN
jgi:hypothetical protein